jgi:hypothetical protein
MKHRYPSILKVWLCLIASSAFGQSSAIKLSEPEIPYSVPPKMWELPLGHHRARVHVASSAPAVWAHLPWRVQMKGMESHQIAVIEAATGRRVQNVVRAAADRMAGDVVFQPATVPGDYFIYYLPLRPHTHLNDMSGYIPYHCEAEAAWLQQNRLDGDALPKGDWRKLPAASVVEFQARTESDRFDPMEVIASPEETKAFLANYPGPLLLFPEDRRHPIRMQADLPLRWIQSGPQAQFTGEAQRHEYFAIQIGLFAPQQAAKNISVTCTPLRSPAGQEIRVTCFNTGGVDSWGRHFDKTVNVPPGRVQPLWFGADVARDQEVGTYVGTVTVQADGIAPQTVAVRLRVLPEVIIERGDNEPWRHSRLRWLNSTAGMGDFVPAPYTPLSVKGSQIACLGREVDLGADGLPANIVSGGSGVLDAPVRFVIESEKGPLSFVPGGIRWAKQAGVRVEWQSTAAGDAGGLACAGWMEYDGTLNFRVTLTPSTDLDLRDIRLELPVRAGSAEYLMGAGGAGGLRPREHLWKWTGPFDSFWLGSVSSGLHCELRGGTYHGPMLNLYHPAPPPTWGNDGKGGVSVREVNGTVLATAFSGQRQVKRGQPVTFEFAFLVTPVKPLDPAAHFRTRYFHCSENWTPAGSDPAPTPEALAAGANVVNLHHASIYNPYINYPFLKTTELRQFTEDMHRRNVRVKVYNTVRELSNMATELWALRSLGDEVIRPGDGGGYAWCQEHMITDYRPAWFQRFSDDPPDAAFETSGESRWYNYYIEGIAWLVRNTGIDGLYLDDVTYDRHILQRVRSVMSAEKPGCLIDLHSNTGFSIGPANQYAEFMPYVDRTWFGESFNYNAMTPDQWLVQVSGIPFGVMGEMLQAGGNPWRGPLYGMTTRLGWRTDGHSCDPRPVWRVWDQFGLPDSQMHGYWDANCPVKTDSSDVPATVFMKPGRALIALASWAPARTEVRLKFDWQALGIDPSKAILYAPRSAGFQKAQQWKPTDPISVLPARGWLIIVDETGPPASASAAVEDKLPRAILLEERFTQPLSPAWTLMVSRQPGTSVRPGTNGLLISAKANHSAAVERKLPAGVTAVECRIENLGDRGETWGPGVALFWPGGQALRLNIRTPENGFGVDTTAGAQQIGLGRYDSEVPVTLRLRIESASVIAEACEEDGDWQPLAVFPRNRFPDAPDRVMLGKACGIQGATDYATPGAAGSSAISWMRAYGE